MSSENKDKKISGSTDKTKGNTGSPMQQIPRPSSPGPKQSSVKNQSVRIYEGNTGVGMQTKPNTSSLKPNTSNKSGSNKSASKK